MRTRLEALGALLALSLAVHAVAAEEPKSRAGQDKGTDRPGDAASPPPRDASPPSGSDRGIEKPGKRGTANTAGPGSSGNTPGPAGTGRTGPGGTDCASGPGGCAGDAKVRGGRPAGR